MGPSVRERKGRKATVWRRVGMLAGWGLLVGLVVGIGGAWVVGGALMGAVRKVVGAAPEGAVGVEIQSADGVLLAGWELDAPGERGVVVLLHGIGGDRRAMWVRAQWLLGLGYSSVMIDFRAHGESGGERTTAGWEERLDARAAVEYARARFAGEPLAVLGVSMGGAAALYASPLGIEALVLESVYSDLEQAIHNRVEQHLGALAGLPAWLLAVQVPWRLGIGLDRLRPIDWIRSAGCPVLVLSGAQDRHTHESETEALFERAVEPKELWVVPGAAHVDLCSYDPGEYQRRVGAFLERSLFSTSPGK